VELGRGDIYEKIRLLQRFALLEPYFFDYQRESDFLALSRCPGT